MKNSNFGVMYVVTTHTTFNYLDAAIASARSVKKCSPNLGIHIFTDAQGLKHVEKLKNSSVDSTGLIDNPHYRSKVDLMSKSPFERTLYLDSDTRVVADITELFDLLERFDYALAHAHNRNHDKTSQIWNIDIPSSFPQYNSGVFLYKNSADVNQLLDKWVKSFHAAGFKKDQVTLRELLWQSNLRLATLPPEYNVRHEKYVRIWRRRKKEAKPRILHMAKFNHKNKIMFILRKTKRRLFNLLNGEAK